MFAVQGNKRECTYAKFESIHSKGIFDRDIILLNKMYIYHVAPSGIKKQRLRRFPNSIFALKMPL